MGHVTVFGPPGTGKTTLIIKVINDFLRDTPLERISYFSFTRAAVEEGLARLGLETKTDNHWFRTVHSACFRMLGLTKDRVISPKWISEFSKTVGMEISNEESSSKKADEENMPEFVLRMRRLAESKKKKPGDLFLSLYHLSRLVSRSEAELAQCRIEPHESAVNLQVSAGVSSRAYATFVEKYESEKARTGTVDFTDMLELALVTDIHIPFQKLVIVDEAQDLSPLQLAVIDKIFQHAETTMMVGDDDQAIMGFQGSNASDFLSYRSRGSVIVLEKTWRFGQALVDFSAKIAGRISERQQKKVIGVEGRDTVIRYQSELEMDTVGKSKSEFILHRHLSGCRNIAGLLLAEGVPFLNERGVNPLGYHRNIEQYTAWKRLCDGTQELKAMDLQSLSDCIPSVKTLEERKVRLMIHGAKQKLTEMDPMTPIDRLYLSDYFSSEFMMTVFKRDPVYVDISFQDYYKRLEEKGVSLLEKPSIIVTTIHGSKGRESDTVHLFDETYSRNLRRFPDDEARVAYVGATRAKTILNIVSHKITGQKTSRFRYP